MLGYTVVKKSKLDKLTDFFEVANLKLLKLEKEKEKLETEIEKVRCDKDGTWYEYVMLKNAVGVLPENARARVFNVHAFKLHVAPLITNGEELNVKSLAQTHRIPLSTLKRYIKDYKDQRGI